MRLMSRVRVTAFFVVLLISLEHAKSTDTAQAVMPAEALLHHAGAELLQWMVFCTDDSSNFSDPHYNDSHWQKASSSVGGVPVPKGEWKGVGWFRVHVALPQELKSTALALRIYSLGGVSVFVDGKPIRSFGNIHAREAADSSTLMEIFPLDPVMERSATLDTHVIAFRVRTPVIDVGMFDSKQIAFGALLGPITEYYRLSATRYVDAMRTLAVPAGAVAALCLLHLLIWLLDRKETVNLYYVAFALFLTGIFWCWHIQGTSENSSLIILTSKILPILWTLIIASALVLTTKIYQGSVSTAQWFAVIVLTAIVLLVPRFVQGIGTHLWGGFVVLATLYVMWQTAQSIRKKVRGAWIMGTALLVFSTYLITWLIPYILEDYMMFTGKVWRAVFISGILSMPLGMSVFLAYRITSLNSILRTQLQRVSELTESILQKERSAMQEELRMQRLQEENDRKTRELDEAMKLQYSMLPTESPRSSLVNVSVVMQTATEVGGDYFDYYVHSDRHITFAIGDATGHGLRAGMVVAATKSHFQTHAISANHNEIIERSSYGIRQLNLPGLYMCFGLLTVKDDVAQWTSAGIPPVLHYRMADKSVEQYMVKGLPLGAPPSGEYSTVTFSVASGDALLLHTDGLPELFNDNNETFGYGRIREALAHHGHKSEREVVSILETMATEWCNARPFTDDVTVMLIRIQ